MERVLLILGSYVVVFVGAFIFGVLFGRANPKKVSTVVSAGQTVAKAATTVASDVKKV